MTLLHLGLLLLAMTGAYACFVAGLLVMLWQFVGWQRTCEIVRRALGIDGRDR